jgi:hypothetical protein
MSRNMNSNAWSLLSKSLFSPQGICCSKDNQDMIGKLTLQLCGKDKVLKAAYINKPKKDLASHSQN